MNNHISKVALKDKILEYAEGLGFGLVRIASSDPLEEDGSVAIDRVRKGYFDGMSWFTEDRVRSASNPQFLLPGAKSVIVVALSYLPKETSSYHGGNLVGRIAKYAEWVDYHDVLKDKLKSLIRFISEYLGYAFRSRIFVDDGPMLERGLAQRAGIGWFGKNTNILTSKYGSWVFLGSVVTDLELEIDESLKKDCGTCAICIDACPTNAIIAPYVIDARRCISYLTIECRGIIPRHLRPLMGDWIFGCDICQDVCPVNRDVTVGDMDELKHTGFSVMELLPLLSISDEEFSLRFRNTPIKRAKRIGLQRNVCVALGNLGDLKAVPTLGKVMEYGDPLVQCHAAWALGKIGGNNALGILNKALGSEIDESVREEIVAVFSNMNDGVSNEMGIKI